MTFRKKVEFKIKAAFFALFRGILKKGDSRRIPLDGTRMLKILFLRPDRIGDTVCSFPLMDHLKKTYPYWKMSIYASPKNIGLINNDPRFENIYIYRRNIIKDVMQVFAIRREKYDLLVDMMGDDSVTTLFLSQFCVSKAPRIGVNKRKFGRYYDFSYVQPENCEEHTIDINLHLLEAFELKPSEADPFAPPYVPEKSDKKAGDFLEEIKKDKEYNSIIGFNLSSRGANRDWGEEKSQELVRRLVNEYPNTAIVLITVPGEREKGERVLKGFDSNVYHIFANANLSEVSALLSKMDSLISPDTSLVHIARSFDIPVIGLYPEYKKVYRQWLPYRQPEGLVLSYGDDNIFNITVEEVFAKFREMVSGKAFATGRS